MFYHAAMLFDYKGFAKEAAPLARAVEEGSLVLLHHRASEIAKHISPETFILHDYGEPLNLLQSISEIETSPYRNSKIGKLFTVVMSTYLEPCSKSLGYNWRILIETLKDLKCKDNDLEKLYYGLPVGLLITPEATDQHVKKVEHNDPYWRWIRLDYSYNQGGWLPLEECQRLRTALKQVSIQLSEYNYQERSQTTETQNQSWKNSLQQGYEDAMEMLSLAIESKKGLYMVVLWDWGEEDD